MGYFKIVDLRPSKMKQQVLIVTHHMGIDGWEEIPTTSQYRNANVLQVDAFSHNLDAITLLSDDIIICHFYNEDDRMVIYKGTYSEQEV